MFKTIRSSISALVTASSAIFRKTSAIASLTSSRRRSKNCLASTPSRATATGSGAPAPVVNCCFSSTILGLAAMAAKTGSGSQVTRISNWVLPFIRWNASANAAAPFARQRTTLPPSGATVPNLTGRTGVHAMTRSMTCWCASSIRANSWRSPVTGEGVAAFFTTAAKCLPLIR